MASENNRTRRKRKPRWNVSDGMARFDTQGNAWKPSTVVKPKQEKENRHGKFKQ